MEKPLVSPYSRKPAVFYDATLRERVPPPVRRGQSWYAEKLEDLVTPWHEKFRGKSTAPFLVLGEDGSRLLVEPTVALHSLDLTLVVEQDGRHRYLEARIAPGEGILVYGRVELTPSLTTAGYRGGASAILRMRGTEHEPVVIARPR